jgi:hypothetical protein
MDPILNRKPTTIDWIDVMFAVLCVLHGAFAALVIAGVIMSKQREQPKDRGSVLLIGSKFGVQSVIQTKPD